MPNLFDGLRSSVNALHAAANAMGVTQLNMTNAGVQGYAKQIINQTADSFDISRGLAGGSRSSSSSARSQYAEQAVWTQSSQQGVYDSFTQSANGVDAVLGATDSSGQAGLQGALSSLIQSFNRLQQGATELVNQDDFIQKSQAFAQTLSQTADFLGQSGAMAESRIQVTVDQINGIVQGVQQWNTQLAAGSEPDPMSEAKVYASLEKLSSLAPITVQKETNGSLTILLNGQTPLLQASVLSPLSVSYKSPDPSAPFPNATASIRILDSAGEDVTDVANSGQLGGLVRYVNEFLPTLMGDSNQQGDLNRMAQGVADSVNAAVGGATPVFQYDTNSTDVARTIKMNTSFSTNTLAAAISGNPTVLTNLSDISSGSNPANQIDGHSYSSFFVAMSTRTASQLSAATNSQSLQTGLTEQARTFRESVQGATVEESAVSLLEYQRAFEAASKVIGVLDDLTKMTINLIP
jgi:flagellar hook-associated protein 1